MATLRIYAVVAVLFIVLECAFSRPVSESSRHSSETDSLDLQEAVHDLQDLDSLLGDVYASRPGILQELNTDGETGDSEPNENRLADANGGDESREDQPSAAEVILRRVRRRSRVPRPVHRGNRMASRLLVPSQSSRTTRPKRMMPRIMSPLSSRNVGTIHDRAFTKRRSKSTLGKKCKWCGLNYFLQKIKVYGDWNRKQSLHRYV
ncbi:Hypp1451 [Branchiostoma lanceolatum]|uniref:Hypp1451 protein n=1 Tax=Branchiostoma lanceolatum TaxID=7740 RepID=A0A8K0EKV5_BRALA|nr:Hypp1451 [Branchiostoma lanceolatum]